ncbi:MAG: hypothetical protein HQK54_15455, partial [Oligoflexales bacterium]|nr:hypothetical protein [Oligoflexales bacterium]
FSKGSSLKLSRRGTVSLKYTGDGVWRIAALKKGIVQIMEKISENEDGRQILVIVNSIRDSSDDIKEETPEFLKQYCGIYKDVKCDTGGYRIFGSISLWKVFFEIKKECAQLKSCIFDLSLSESGMNSLDRHWNSLLSPFYSVRINAAGKGLVMADCDRLSIQDIERFVDHLSDGAVDSEKLIVKCRSDFLEGDFILRAKAFYLEDEEAQKFGLDTEGIRKGGMVLNNSVLSHSIKAFLNDNRSRIIGEPFLRLRSGKKGSVRSGSEIKMNIEGKAQSEIFKKIGLNLEATPTPLSETKTLVSFNMDLSHPQADYDHAVLQSSSISGEVVLTWGVPKVVGEMDTTTEAKGSFSLPFIRKIPVIGPIFTLFKEGKARSRIFLWLMILKDEDSKFDEHERMSFDGKEF